MTVVYDWSGDQFCLNPVNNLVGVQQLATIANTADDWGVARIDFAPKLCARVTIGGLRPPYWWVSADVSLDASYSVDGATITPNPISDDPRLLWMGSLTPRVSVQWEGVAGTTHQFIVWEPGSMVPQSRTKRQGIPGDGFQPTIQWNLRAVDNYGVFAGATTLADKAFGWNMSTRVLWYRPV